MSELRRREAVLAGSPSDDPLILQLVAAADQFIAARGGLETVIAGYHWFSDWGRDAMIALPGIALVTGRFETAQTDRPRVRRKREVRHAPQSFPDAGESPEYNTVDATLWFFEAVRAYVVLANQIRPEESPTGADWEIDTLHFDADCSDGFAPCRSFGGIQRLGGRLDMLVWCVFRRCEWSVPTRSE
jgi:hypothetical protein